MACTDARDTWDPKCPYSTLGIVTTSWSCNYYNHERRKILNSELFRQRLLGWSVACKMKGIKPKFGHIYGWGNSQMLQLGWFEPRLLIDVAGSRSHLKKPSLLTKISNAYKVGCAEFNLIVAFKNAGSSIRLIWLTVKRQIFHSWIWRIQRITDRRTWTNQFTRTHSRLGRIFITSFADCLLTTTLYDITWYISFEFT